VGHPHARSFLAAGGSRWSFRSGSARVLGNVVVVEPNSWVGTVERAPVGQAKCHTRRNSAQPHEMGVKREGDGSGRVRQRRARDGRRQRLSISENARITTSKTCWANGDVHRADVFNAATLGGCRVIRRDDLGRLAPGAKGDILLIDLDHMPRRSRMIRTRAGQRMVIALVTLLLDSLVSEIAPVASMITIT
jgi:hypothetical protein